MLKLKAYQRIFKTFQAFQIHSDRDEEGKGQGLDEPLVAPPYKTKTCEPIPSTTKDERKQLLAAAHYNLFHLSSSKINLDFLTDSGTGAMSAQQTACLITGDETYAGSSSFDNFQREVKSLTGFHHVIPVHQGRAAERLLFPALGVREGSIVPNNGHFDTTQANIEYLGGLAIDLPCERDGGRKPSHFGGNMNVEALRHLLVEQCNKVPFVLMSITNNKFQGQPVSLQNIREVAALCSEFSCPLIIDGCRFAENAYFIKKYEGGYGSSSVERIVREIFSYAGGMTMSAKKDGLSHTGGWIGIREEYSKVLKAIHELLVLTEGFLTYGGLSGRDLDAIALGLREAVDYNYLQDRVEGVRVFGKMLEHLGVPIIKPIGGHAIYVDANAFFKGTVAREHFPAATLAALLYVEGGIRVGGFGKLMFPKDPQELVRIALPRRVYDMRHFDYAVQVFRRAIQLKGEIKGLKIVEGEDSALRHFTAKLAPI